MTTDPDDWRTHPSDWFFKVEAWGDPAGVAVANRNSLIEALREAEHQLVNGATKVLVSPTRRKVRPLFAEGAARAG